MSSESDGGSSSSESDDSESSSSSGSSSSSSEAETEVEERSTSTPKDKVQADASSSSETSSSDSSSTSEDELCPRDVSAAHNRALPKPSSALEQTHYSVSNSQSLALSHQQSNEICMMKEPERARAWLAAVLETDTESRVVQSDLYFAYRTQFSDDCANGNNLITAKTLISEVTRRFEGAEADHVTVPHDEYVIKGVRLQIPSETPISVSIRPSTAPGKGKIATRKRNIRRRRHARETRSSTKLAKTRLWMMRTPNSMPGGRHC